jgi:hypothetical protein
MVSKLYTGTLIANVKMDRDRGNRLILTVSAQFDRVSVGLLVGVPSFFNRLHVAKPACALARGLHFGLIHKNQGHVGGTLTAEPEMLQLRATRFRRQNKLINLAIAQVVEFSPAVRISTVADHHIH